MRVHKLEILRDVPYLRQKSTCYGFLKKFSNLESDENIFFYSGKSLRTTKSTIVLCRTVPVLSEKMLIACGVMSMSHNDKFVQ